MPGFAAEKQNCLCGGQFCVLRHECESAACESVMDLVAPRAIIALISQFSILTPSFVIIFVMIFVIIS
jgi:hypothetical protein